MERELTQYEAEQVAKLHPDPVERAGASLLVRAMNAEASERIKQESGYTLALNQMTAFYNQAHRYVNRLTKGAVSSHPVRLNLGKWLIYGGAIRGVFINRHGRYIDYRDQVINGIRRLTEGKNIEIVTGNDAPRGGLYGWYITVSFL